jgi:hypothetical protein
MTDLERKLRELLHEHYSVDFDGSVLEKLRAAANLGAEDHRDECAARGCMWCKEQRRASSEVP